MAKIEISAKPRPACGKGAARKVRKENNIPAIVYGNNAAPLAIELDGHVFGELIKKPGLRTKLFVIDTGASKENAMLVDIQYHPVKDVPMHADFKRIDIGAPVSVSVPLGLLNVETSKGLKLGGALNFAVRSILIEALVDDIPDRIDIDIASMNITDTIHGGDLSLPDGVKLGLRQADLALVTITGKMKEEEAAAPAAGTAAAPAAAPKADEKKPDGKKAEAKKPEAKK
ncbi:MAG: 50S ribosomal protein L25/general stress protein Ctc [Rickettsiales bacterium]|jgi:large subunit ribosomal protein L25|nr:50S ribosomal protein L25/general stress protein Ctc [Rickettsiales bacterium]